MHIILYYIRNRINQATRLSVLTFIFFNTLHVHVHIYGINIIMRPSVEKHFIEFKRHR